jgi:hypothetical protein
MNCSPLYMFKTAIFAAEFGANPAEEGSLLEGLRAAYQTLDPEERQRIKCLMADLAEKLQRSRLQGVES